MAEIIDDIRLHADSNGRKSKYPFDEWFDGKARRFTRGKDYAVSTHAFRSYMYSAAKRRGVTLRAVNATETSIDVQAYAKVN